LAGLSYESQKAKAFTQSREAAKPALAPAAPRGAAGQGTRKDFLCVAFASLRLGVRFCF